MGQIFYRMCQFHPHGAYSFVIRDDSVCVCVCVPSATGTGKKVQFDQEQESSKNDRLPTTRNANSFGRISFRRSFPSLDL